VERSALRPLAESRGGLQGKCVVKKKPRQRDPHDGGRKQTGGYVTAWGGKKSWLLIGERGTSGPESKKDWHTVVPYTWFCWAVANAA